MFQLFTTIIYKKVFSLPKVHEIQNFKYKILYKLIQNSEQIYALVKSEQLFFWYLNIIQKFNSNLIFIRNATYSNISSNMHI
ncbi:hypothetical protein BpHYR1_015718 [Brachionus plicatilis]|uniref:Uncharacterized protein n=1 Tax=Brachionus plicatilis TaxID=10195 RepID=A0A3M7RAD4_BRAPC|nr:hypothetical protein BpHYR1_015718 [Brachionus plicatilis]